MDYPEICDKHKFNDARTRTNHTTNTNTVEIYNSELVLFFTKKTKWIKGLNSSEFSFCYVHVQIQLVAGQLEPEPPDFKSRPKLSPRKKLKKNPKFSS